MQEIHQEKMKTSVNIELEVNITEQFSPITSIYSIEVTALQNC